MPWEPSIIHPKGEQLGSLESVLKHLSDALPGFKWFEEPSLISQIESVPNHPFQKLVETWSEEERRRAANPRTLGEFESGDVSICFYGFEAQALTSILLEVRGRGDPLPYLRRLCTACNWQVFDDTVGEVVDLSRPMAFGWERFGEYRDSVVNSDDDSE